MADTGQLINLNPARFRSWISGPDVNDEDRSARTEEIIETDKKFTRCNNTNADFNQTSKTTYFKDIATIDTIIMYFTTFP